MLVAVLSWILCAWTWLLSPPFFSSPLFPLLCLRYLHSFSQFAVFPPVISQIISTPGLCHLPCLNLQLQLGRASGPTHLCCWARLQAADTCHFLFCLSCVATQPRYNVMGAAGENESPDSHPGHGVQENARFSGLNVILRAQVQAMEDTGGHLGPDCVSSK